MSEFRVRYKTFGDKKIFIRRRSQRDTPALVPSFVEWMNLTFGDSWRIEFAHENVRNERDVWGWSPYGNLVGNRGGWLRLTKYADIVLSKEGDEVVYRLHWDKRR